MLILDTHIWHWWFNQIPDRLPATIIDLIETADELAISSISCFEMAWLAKHGRIDLGMSFDEWLSINHAHQSVMVLPVDQQIASRAVA
jgi:PIN domain nuclease of toxin-antitoxin system